MVANKKLKVFFHPIDAAGHINACVGLAQALAKRDHQIFFLTNISFKGQFEIFGFNEILLKNHNDLDKEANGKSKNESETKPLKELAEVFAENGFLSNLNSLESLKRFGNDSKLLDEMVKKMIAYNDQVKESIEREKPDVIIVDHFIFEPVILYSNIPWIWLFSCSPLGIINSKELPPFSSGYPVDSDKETWKEFEEALDGHYETAYWKRQNRVLRHFNYPELKRESYICQSPYMNVYGYPEELDYHDVVRMPKNLIRVDAFCRNMPELFELPVEFQNKIKPDDKLIYVSLGSIGSFNIELLKKMVSILGKTQHKYIFSKGPLHDEFELADNMWGEEYVPQTSILPLVDLVITHGGNNTVTEAFKFGKPMIVMPMFLDQFDNAQRVHEKGFGIRLHTYEYTEQQLVDAVERLLNDAQLNQELSKIAYRMQHSNSKELACIEIEQMVENFHLQPVNNQLKCIE